ncbi:transposase [Parasphingorhabdus halotolerans]|uniref:transposase n=1 Tax=Parasphingorhabdus halotolerans TaxID=2725558 RepID=UPI001FE31A6A|nr:transposase [Parasphingorhabdus halotolerans]
MNRIRFTEEQVVGVLREAEAGTKTADLARKHGVSEATLCNWKSKYGGLEVSEAKRLRGLELENAQLKKLLADTMLDNAGLKDLLFKKVVTPAARREVVLHFQALDDVSQRRACRIIEADRTSMRYQSRRDDDADLRDKLRALAQERHRFGYRRLHILLCRDGMIIYRKKTQRLDREEGLTVRRRKGRKRAVGTTILDDCSRYTVRQKLCTTMRAEDVPDTFELALEASGYGHVHVLHKRRLLSNNGSSYVASELADKNMKHVRSALFHPQTRSKIKRWHQILKNRIPLEHYYRLGRLETQVEAFVEYYNHQRHRESLKSVTPAHVYFGSTESIIKQRAGFKRKKIEQRRLHHRKIAAYYQPTNGIKYSPVLQRDMSAII